MMPLNSEVPLTFTFCFESWEVDGYLKEDKENIHPKFQVDEIKNRKQNMSQDKI